MTDLAPFPIDRLGAMRLLDRTLPDVKANLALDEAILQEVEDDGLPPILRLWEMPRMAVILGASCRIREDVHVEACQADGVVVARRSSGGGTVVIGPGALNAAVVLPLDLAPELAAVDVAQRCVLECLAEALRARGLPVRVQGSGDLTVGVRKVAGSAQRRLRGHFLIHTTILYNFPLDRIARYTCQPRRQPDYRLDRPHEDFVVNLACRRAALVEAVRAAWMPPGRRPVPCEVPSARVQALVGSKFGDPAWTGRF